jgi:hypothetical protein
MTKLKQAALDCPELPRPGKISVELSQPTPRIFGNICPVRRWRAAIDRRHVAALLAPAAVARAAVNSGVARLPYPTSHYPL